jgi:predicted Zn-dependent protease
VVLGAHDDVATDDDLMVLRGDLRRAQGDLDGARSAYETVLSRDPARADVALRLHAAAAEMSLASPDAGPDAVRDLERIGRELLADQPESAEARLGIARALLVRRDGSDEQLDEARKLLKEALELEPLLFEAQIALAVADLRTGRAVDAVLALERVIAALPTERPRLRLLLAQGCLAMGAANRGLDEARRAVDGLGDDTRALQLLVRAAQTAGDRDEALDTLRRLAMLEPDEIAHPIAQAFLYADRGEMGAADRAIADAQAIAEALPEGEERSAALRAVTGGKAAALARAGDIDGARGAFQALVGRLPRDVEARVRYGRFLQATGDDAAAENVFREAVRIDDLALLPRRALVELWTDRGELTEELTAMVRRMRVVGGDDPVVLYAEGRLAALQGDLRIAVERLQAAAAERSDDGDIHFALGVVHSQAGNLAEAVASLRRTVALFPQSTRARDALSRARFAHAQELTRTGRLRAARELLEDAVRDDPTAGPTRVALADALRYAGQSDLSEVQVRAMIERDPDDMLARRMLACALAARGAMKEAAEELALVASAEPDDWTAWAALSAAYLELGSLPEAESAAARSRAAEPTEPGSIGPTVELLVRSGRAADAGRTLDAEVVRYPEEPIYRLMRAMIHAQMGEHRKTVEAASAALDLAPDMSRAAHLAVTALRFGLGDSDGALAFAKARAAKAPDSPDMAYLVGWLEARRGNADGALAALAPLVEREPPHQDALSSSVLILLEQRETAEARRLIDAGLAVNPENPSFHFMRAQAVLLDALAMGDATIEGPARTVVVRSLERTLELAPQHHTARNNLAFVLSSDREQLGDALEHAERAMKQAPGHAPYADTLGTIQLKLDRVHAAIATFERGLEVIAEARAQLKADAAAAVVKSEPDRLRRLSERLDRQESELRRHHDEALRRRGD